MHAFLQSTRPLVMVAEMYIDRLLTNVGVNSARREMEMEKTVEPPQEMWMAMTVEPQEMESRFGCLGRLG